MSFTVQQDVLRLQIAVDDFFEVEVLYCAHDLRGIEQARGVAEAPAAAQVAEELSAWDEVHQHVQEALIVVGPKSEKSEQKKRGDLTSQVLRMSLHKPTCPFGVQV